MPPDVSSTRVRIGRRRFGDEPVADRREDMADCDAAVLHRHGLAQIVGIEGPGVDDLLALRVDHFDPLALAKAHGLTLARRDFDHHAAPLGLTVDEFSGPC